MSAAAHAQRREEFAAGAMVELRGEAGKFGTVCKRDGEMVQVKFCESGSSSWKSYTDLTIVDALNDSLQSAPATSDDEPDYPSTHHPLAVVATSPDVANKVVVEVDDVKKARFCKKCDAVFEEVIDSEHATHATPQTKCKGGHANFNYSKTIPKGRFQVVKRATPRPPYTCNEGSCGRLSTCNTLGAVDKKHEVAQRVGSSPDMNRDGQPSSYDTALVSSDSGSGGASGGSASCLASFGPGVCAMFTGSVANSGNDTEELLLAKGREKADASWTRARRDSNPGCFGGTNSPSGGRNPFQEHDKFKKGNHARTANGTIGAVLEDAVTGGGVQLQMAADGSHTSMLQINTLTLCTEAEYEAERDRWAMLRSQFNRDVLTKTPEGTVGVIIADAAATGRRANEVRLRLADGSDSTVWAKVNALSQLSEAEAAEYDGSPWLQRVTLIKGTYVRLRLGLDTMQHEAHLGEHESSAAAGMPVGLATNLDEHLQPLSALTADTVGMIAQDAPARGWAANTVHLRLPNGSQSERVPLGVLSKADGAAYETEKAVWAALRCKFKQGTYAKADGSVGVVIAEATTSKARTGYHGTFAANAASILKYGFRPSKSGMLGRGVYWTDDLRKVGRYSRDGTVLKLRVECGKTATVTGQGHYLQRTWRACGYDSAWVPAGCGMVNSELSETCTYDPRRVRVIGITHDHDPASGVAGSWREVEGYDNHGAFDCTCNEVILKRADGSKTSWVALERLSEATEDEIAEYDAAQASLIELRSQFGAGVKAKTAEGELGMILPQWHIEEESTVWLELADRSRTSRNLDTLSVCTDAELAEYEAARDRWAWARLRSQFKRDVLAKTEEGTIGVIIADAAAEGPRENEVQLRLADGSDSTVWAKVDTLLQLSEAEAAERGELIERARLATMREKFRRGTHVSTVDGRIGVVMDNTCTHTVQLLLADNSLREGVSMDQLADVASRDQFQQAVTQAGLSPLQLRYYPPPTTTTWATSSID